MTSSLHDRICEAIRTGRVVRFSYAGGGIRVVEPHSYGVTAAGEECLLGYQTGGYSSEPRPHGWCSFDVVGIEGLVLTDGRALGRRPGHPTSDAFTTVFCMRHERSGEDRRRRARRSDKDRRTKRIPIDFPDRRKGGDRREGTRRTGKNRREGDSG